MRIYDNKYYNKVLEIYGRELYYASPSYEQLEFKYQGQTYKLWSLNIKKKGQVNQFGLDPAERNEIENVEVKDEDLVLVVTVHDMYASDDLEDATSFDLPVTDPLLDQFLEIARNKWPEIEEEVRRLL